MGRPRIGKELKKPSDYKYDFPGNREISSFLTPNDKNQIAYRTGYCIRTVHYWCQGVRRNARIEEWARRMARLNIAKQRKLDNSTKCKS